MRCERLASQVIVGIGTAPPATGWAPWSTPVVRTWLPRVPGAGPGDPELLTLDGHERKFVANRSMRDVELTVDVYVTTLKSGAQAREEG